MKILITEDEPILADELENIIHDLGHEVVGVATSLRGAMKLVERSSCDVALVDVHLTDGATGTTVARRIAEDTRTAVIFTTSNPGRIPDDFADACGVLTKPLSEQNVKAAIGFVVECMAKGRATRPKPRALRLSPTYAARWQIA